MTPWTIVAIGAALALVITAISRHVIERAASDQERTPEWDRGFDAGLARAEEIARGARCTYYGDDGMRDGIARAIRGARRGS